LYLEHLKRKVSENHWGREVFLPRKGDVLMWHGALIHGGTPMKNRRLTRKSFICHYTSLESHHEFSGQANNGYEINGGHIFGKAPARIQDAMVAKGLKSSLKKMAERVKRKVLK
jgi:hypothetical protein